MKNLYLLKKEKGQAGKRIAAVVCRFGVVLGCVAILGVWAGMEFGALMLGRRLLWTVLLAGFVGLCGWADGRLE